MSNNAPSWDALYELASGQAGHFTTAQAEQAGYSSQLLYKHLKAGRIERVRRGVYRLVHFPASDDEDLVVLWLWSEHLGVFSHETALVRHDLSDLLPHQIEMTVPTAWRERRLRTPEGLVLHYADLEPHERTWHGAVPLTTPLRTVRDCLASDVSPEFVQQAVQQGIRRGLFDRADIERPPPAEVIR